MKSHNFILNADCTTTVYNTTAVGDTDLVHTVIVAMESKMSSRDFTRVLQSQEVEQAYNFGHELMLDNVMF